LGRVGGGRTVTVNGAVKWIESTLRERGRSSPRRMLGGRRGGRLEKKFSADREKKPKAERKVLKNRRKKEIIWVVDWE